MAQAAEEFAAPYDFDANDVTVVLRHSLDANLRAAVQHPGEVNKDGGYGTWARWSVKTRNQNGTLEAQFKNEKTGDFLRITKDKVDAGGKGGPLCWFRVHFQNVGYVKLESVKHEGSYVAIDKDGVRIGKGGPWCRLNVLKEGQAPPFSKPYLFLKKQIVVIEHRERKNMRVKAVGHELGIEGRHGEFAQFEATPGDGGKTVQLKSCKNDGYLRIHQDTVDCNGKGGKFTHFRVHPVDAPNQVRLESVEHAGKFVTLDHGKKTFVVGDGKHKYSFLTFYRNA